ncbi:MAG: acyl-CoA dehydrogenase family protein [Candidatus Sericytochromatia bacterium]|nr:acyl-CoA dehydrogenase family protein [Candidatus Sericytochromatia bacterium]
MSDFFQEAPVLNNQYQSDKLLKSYLKRLLPSDIIENIEKDLNNLGERVTTDILDMANDAEKNTPQLTQFDPWGNRIDKIVTSQGWKLLDQVAAQEGMIAIGYERKYQEFSRIYQFAKLYLFNPSSALYTCPLAMTDGATKLIEIYGDEELKNEAYQHLTSRDPEKFWTSGQWMTEKVGGSDVGQSETIARLENGEYKLYGTKWFTSATTSQMAITLARIEDENGKTIDGSRGLSLFYIKLHDEKGNLNNIIIHRLKDKLGTKALPTAELTLNGTIAKLIGGEGGGVRKISSLFNITRIYNATSSIAFMRRGIYLAKDYAKRRNAFGKKLSEHPLHVETLANLEVEFQAAFQTVFYTVSLLGKDELDKATEDEKVVLRLLTPLIKLYTAKQSIKVASEVLESFGGAGYIEDTGLPKLLRDSQVLAIWEGTTNILSLDVLRAIDKEKAFIPFLKNIELRLENISLEQLKKSKDNVYDSLNKIKEFLPFAIKNGADFVEASARDFAYSLFRVFAASLMLEHAQWSFEYENDSLYIITANRWCNKQLAELKYPDDTYRQESNIILF